MYIGSGITVFHHGIVLENDILSHIQSNQSADDGAAGHAAAGPTGSNRAAVEPHQSPAHAGSHRHGSGRVASRDITLMATYQSPSLLRRQDTPAGEPIRDAELVAAG